MNRVQARIGRDDLIIETGKLAKQADGAVTVQLGGTVVLVTAVAAKKPRPGIDFMPLTVEYQEKTYAAGKIPGGFFKREGRPSAKETLTARLVDRPIRPLFPKGLRHEVQVIALVLSHDGVNDPDILAVVGASAALSISDIPFTGPLGAVRVGRVNDQWVVNPTFQEVEQGTLDLVVVTSPDGVIMVEAGAKELPEALMVEALRFGEQQAQAVAALQRELVAACGKPKRTIPLVQAEPALIEQVRGAATAELDAEMARASQKEGRSDAMDALLAKLVEQFAPAGSTTTTPEQVRLALEQVEAGHLRQAILSKRVRADGRDLTTLRPITCEVGVLPRTHGSGLFSRGQTQSLATVTLGTASDEQRIDALEGETTKAFMLHYNFPPFSVGETKPVRSPGRREIGHGALAERALAAVMPSKDQFPYTVRVVSEILESNGSSSMATVCSGTLTLMDAGVPIKAPVSGVAMGLVFEGADRYVVLTDITGLEDHAGDMDFKVAGTAAGITALQLDLKLTGVPLEVLAKAIEQSREPRQAILQAITAVLPSPRPELSAFAPRITKLMIDPEKIGTVIGPGGKMIRKITSESGATVDIEDDGTVLVASNDAAASQKAIAMIKGLTEDVEVGRIYQATVTRLMNFGAFCEISPGREGLCHVSELDAGFVPKVEDAIKVGDTFPVKVIEVDLQGRINVSRKQALPGQEQAPPVPHRREGRGGGDRSRGDRPYRGDGPHGGPPRDGPRRDFGRDRERSHSPR
ncbi:MAG: polyribonucleotide nucleotidyltransferase [Candidatus Omnitrophica bacterium]|nr:polyribonucleotide nucleotidyltransferase [Candidatus Omnitrophota bacterium]